MTKLPASVHRGQTSNGRFSFRFTPAEWRSLLEDEGFLRQPDNSYRPPRRLMGVPVQIVPGHDVSPNGSGPDGSRPDGSRA